MREQLLVVPSQVVHRLLCGLTRAVISLAVGVGMGIKKNKHGQHVITKLLPGGAAEQSGHIFPGVTDHKPLLILFQCKRISAQTRHQHRHADDMGPLSPKPCTPGRDHRCKRALGGRDGHPSPPQGTQGPRRILPLPPRPGKFPPLHLLSSLGQQQGVLLPCLRRLFLVASVLGQWVRGTILGG
jgi:hypothetical protein